ncbi:DNA polymerase III subunit delta [Kordiimonas aestuarii]|uniref:DNA polymerase III subunit delta n=1 Tax=Kordiimonas aestuarii TaxID=1005925 RepID=UPI0021CFB601|nr:DNA polymerase III subunit delta [Kordiimonas aestuarii]
MKAKPRDIPAILKALDPKMRAVLVFGRDDGLVRERAEKIGKQICEDLSDPFQVARPGSSDIKESPSILLDEVAALSMMGGRRLVRLESVGNEATEAVKLVLDSDAGDGLLVITAGDLKPTSSLRKLLEGAKNAIAIACYEDSAQDIMGLVQTVLGNAGLTATQDAVAYLVDNLGGDRMVSRSELDKLVLYKGSAGGQVTIEDAKACVGDTAALGLNQIAEAVTAGNLKQLERFLERAWTSGESAIAILRTLQNRMMRIHLARGFMDQGMSAGEAVGKLRPPVFFGERDKFMGEVSRWSARKVETALDILIEAELACKTTGNPADTICARALLRLAKAAR